MLSGFFDDDGDEDEDDIVIVKADATDLLDDGFRTTVVSITCTAISLCSSSRIDVVVDLMFLFFIMKVLKICG